MFKQSLITPYLLFLLHRKPWFAIDVGGAELALVAVGVDGAEGIGTVAATGGNLKGLVNGVSLLSLVSHCQVQWI